MNNQAIRANWKLIEDFPTKDGFYIVAFEDSSGEFTIENSDIWEFSSGVWVDGEGQSEFPTFYLDNLTMPR